MSFTKSRLCSRLHDVRGGGGGGGWLVPRSKAWLVRLSHGGGGLSSELAPVASPASGRTLRSPDTPALTPQGPAPSRPVRVPPRCT